ncbi:hypothetical protein [Cedecea davisae]|uniref:hypothetical protein n=1 Tax=Cedecea davisae TaxID=158484 RepID=UPI001D0A80B9|nr:hypothetical protein [Cedecea davisae]
MPQSISIPNYYETVLSALSGLAWVRNADSYPEEKTQLATPAVFLSVASWGPGNGASTGQSSVTLECEMYIVCDRSATTEITRPAVFVQSCAADLTQWIAGHTFNIEGLEGAVFKGAEPDAFDPNLDDYLVWRIDFSQDTVMGEDAFVRSGAPLSGVFLGKAPEVGAAHVDDYRQIYGQKEKPDE